MPIKPDTHMGQTLNSDLTQLYGTEGAPFSINDYYLGLANSPSSNAQLFGISNVDKSEMDALLMQANQQQPVQDKFQGLASEAYAGTMSDSYAGLDKTPYPAGFFGPDGGIASAPSPPPLNAYVMYGELWGRIAEMQKLITEQGEQIARLSSILLQTVPDKPSDGICELRNW
jgi:hypothetical protein